MLLSLVLATGLVFSGEGAPENMPKFRRAEYTFVNQRLTAYIEADEGQPRYVTLAVNGSRPEVGNVYLLTHSTLLRYVQIGRSFAAESWRAGSGRIKVIAIDGDQITVEFENVTMTPGLTHGHRSDAKEFVLSGTLPLAMRPAGPGIELTIDGKSHQVPEPFAVASLHDGLLIASFTIVDGRIRHRFRLRATLPADASDMTVNAADVLDYERLDVGVPLGGGRALGGAVEIDRVGNDRVEIRLMDVRCRLSPSDEPFTVSGQVRGGLQLIGN
jgi:hypothetical protein